MNKYEKKWLSSYNLLKEFRKEFPDRWPICTEKYKNQNLGWWCNTQRQAKKGNGESKITPRTNSVIK